MNKLGDINNYNDLTGLQNLKAQASLDPANKQALRKAAEHFESIFMGMMLKSMRKANAVFEKDNPMHSNTTNFFRDMYDQQLTTDLSSKGSLGLADLIVEQLSNDHTTMKPADLLRNDAEFKRHDFSQNKLFEQSELGQLNSIFSSDELEPKQQPQSEMDILQSFRSVVDKTFAQLGGDKLPEQLLNQPRTFETASSAPKEPVKFDTPENFVTSLWQFAKKASAKIGLNPAVMIAQSALETGWGKHIIQDKNGASSFNLFNVKAHRSWNGEKAAHSTLEFENGLPVKKVEPFRVYDNFTQAFDDFVSFLQGNGRYEEALTTTKQPEQFLQNLQKAGYATDPNYADKIIKILNSDSFKKVIGTLENGADNKVGG